ncbi:unnamed protein product, partial [marine sediment metagenome]
MKTIANLYRSICKLKYLFGKKVIDRKRLKFVYEDLCYLRDEWTGSIKEKYLRISGTILRKLLVDGLLITVWNEIKEKSLKVPEKYSLTLKYLEEGTKKIKKRREEIM